MPRSLRTTRDKVRLPLVAVAAGAVFIASVAGYLQSSKDGSDEVATPATTTTVQPVDTTPTTPTTASTQRPGIEGFSPVAFTVTPAQGEPVRRCGLLADTPERQARGLMGQSNLGGYDGMIFAFSFDVRSAFFMANVPVPLSIAFFESDGDFVSAADMPVCNQGGGCPRFNAAGPYRNAIEVLQGGLSALGIGPGSKLLVEPGPC